MEKFFQDIGCGRVHGGTLASFNKFVEDPHIISSSAIFSSFIGAGYKKGGRVSLPKEYFCPKTGGRISLPKQFFCPKTLSGGNAITMPQEFYGLETSHFVENPTMTDTSIGDTLARVGILSGGKSHTQMFTMKHFNNWITHYQQKNKIQNMYIPKKIKQYLLNVINHIVISSVLDTIKKNNGKLSFTQFKANLRKSL
jgi:hypothetical protein